MSKPVTINQVIRYQVGEKTFKSYVEAESHVVDMFGEHFDGICMEVEKETGRTLRFSTAQIKLVEKMWRDRDVLASLLGLRYAESSELHDLAEARAEELCDE